MVLRPGFQRSPIQAKNVDRPFPEADAMSYEFGALTPAFTYATEADNPFHEGVALLL